MYLARLFIKNFKSIRELDLVFTKGKNVLIGRNNSGKSNIVKALDLILGETTPTYARGENLNENDFYSWKERIGDKYEVKSADEIFIWCELCRDSNEKLDYDELYKCYGFYVYSEIIAWDGKKPRKAPKRIPAASLPADYATIFNLTEDSAEKEYVNPKLRNQKTFEQQFEDRHCFVFAFRALKNEDGVIFKDIRFLYREGDSTDWILAFRAPIRTELLQSAIIPSFRDPQTQLRLSSWSWYGRLMRHLTEDHDKQGDLAEAFEKVKAVGDEIFASAKSKIKQSALDVAFPGTELHFQFNPDARGDLYRSCLVYIDDGFKSLLSDKGSGIQSATIIGLFNYYTRHVNTVSSSLLCIEEPEIYLHPHARRVLSDRLDEFLDNNRNQVILTTHSVEFIRTTSEDLNVILVQKIDSGTIASPISIREFKRLLIDNNQNELFFADKVIICEGFDDHLIRAVARERFPKKIDEQNVSILSAGGKDNISQIAKLVLKLGIKCFVFADFDYLLRDRAEDYRKYPNAKPHESVESLGPDFYKQKCTFSNEGPTILAKIQKLRSTLKKSNEQAFYTAKTADTFLNPEITKALHFLRENGLCILDGQIENLSKKEVFLSPSNKLTLDKVYELNGRLESGEKITDLFDVKEIDEFLRVVLDR